MKKSYLAPTLVVETLVSTVCFCTVSDVDNDISSEEFWSNEDDN